MRLGGRKARLVESAGCPWPAGARLGARGGCCCLGKERLTKCFPPSMRALLPLALLLGEEGKSRNNPKLQVLQQQRCPGCLGSYQGNSPASMPSPGSPGLSTTQKVLRGSPAHGRTRVCSLLPVWHPEGRPKPKHRAPPLQGEIVVFQDKFTADI